jgi:hypothetical protein
MERKDYNAAADAFRRGSLIPNTHPFLKTMAAKMSQKGGDLENSMMLWTITYDSTEDPMIKQNAADHILAVRAEQDLNGLNKIIDLYWHKTSRYPNSWRDLYNANLLPGIPVDPVGFPYALAPGGEIYVRHPEKLKYLHRNLPPGYKPSVEAEMDARN